jgi:hypothetical protein
MVAADVLSSLAAALPAAGKNYPGLVVDETCRLYNREWEKSHILMVYVYAVARGAG